MNTFDKDKKIAQKTESTELKKITIAVAGNPNSGKTTLFNALTGSNQHVGNYPGVTVEKKVGYRNYKNYRLEFVDLPGTYSLSSYSLEERIARDYVIENKPDIVLDVIDASNLERNLYLTTQLIELGANLVLALNMSDEADRQGMRIDYSLLEELLDSKAIPTVASAGRGIEQILDAIIESAEKPSTKPVKVEYGHEMENAISELEKDLAKLEIIASRFDLRWAAQKLLEYDPEIINLIGEDHPIIRKTENLRGRIQQNFGDDPELIIADRRYGFVAGIYHETVRTVHISRRDLTKKIDTVLANRILGIPFFLFFMWATFQLTFIIGEYPHDLLESGFDWLADFASGIIPVGWLSSLIADGIIAGVGEVLVHLPFILLLFLAIAILEDSGYMARASFIMDKVMHLIGLHGKSFMPMLIGFGCSIPAFMATRTLETPHSRLMTMLIIPFMSCGAKIPVYVLFASAFFPDQAGNVIFIIYISGIVLAILVALLLKKLYFKGPETPFVMELPPYRMPTSKSVVYHMWRRAWMYIRKAGTIILAASIIIWIATTYPPPFSSDQASTETTVETQLEISEIENSMAGRLGKSIEPVLRPLGFDWRLGIALITGFAAKEVVVSTLGTIYAIEDADEESPGLRQALQDDPNITPLVAFCFMIFVLIYVPCVAAASVFFRETGSAKWTAFMVLYTTSVAWLVAFIVYQAGTFLEIGV